MAKSSASKKGKRNRNSLSTRAIHAGELRRKYADSLMTPIIQTSTFTFRDSKHIEDYTKKGKVVISANNGYIEFADTVAADIQS